MEISYQLTKEDLLSLQMYFSGQSSSQKKTRFKRRIMVPIIWNILALYCLNNYLPNFAIALFILSLFWFIAYPAYSKYLHTRHFKKHIEENNQGLLNEQNSLKLEEEGIRSSSTSGVSLLKYSAVESLTEIETLYLLKLKTGQTLPLPKESIGIEILKPFMEELSKRSNLEILNHIGKSWK